MVVRLRRIAPTEPIKLWWALFLSALLIFKIQDFMAWPRLGGVLAWGAPDSYRDGRPPQADRPDKAHQTLVGFVFKCTTYF
jgi:hypothetical protein